jgi:hypothetical protein
MYYGDQLPSLSTYAEALAWYQSRQPYKRGRSKDLRPLGQNRRYDRSLIALGDLSVGSVILLFHQTPVITFYPDNSIVLNNGGWETVGTMDFINAVLRNRFAENRGKWSGVTRRRGKMYFADGIDKDHRFERVLKLDADNEVTGGSTEVEWVLDKERMAKVRKHYAEFAEYLTYYTQMVGTRLASEIVQQKKLSVSKNELRWQTAPHVKDREEFFYTLDLAMLEGNEDQLALFLPLAEQVTVNAANKQYDWAAQIYKYQITPQMARDFFYDLCRYQFADYLFKNETVVKGKVVLDENAKYLQYKSEATISFAV